MGLLDQLNKESKSKIAPPSEVVKIEVTQLQEHPSNFFSMDENELEALKEDIQSNGLNTCIRIRKLPESHELYAKNKPYQILVGHRRFRAVSQTSIKFIDCKVVECSDIEAEKILITDNMTARKITPQEQLEAIRRLKDLFKKEKEQNKLPGRIQNLIAQETGLSTSQVANYEKILNNGSQKTLEAIQDGNLGIKGAVILTNLDETEQDDFIEEFEDKEIKVSDIKKRVEDMKKSIKNKENEEIHESYKQVDVIEDFEDDEFEAEDVEDTEEVNVIEAVEFSLSIINKQVTRVDELIGADDYIYGVQLEIIKKAVSEIRNKLCDE